MLRIILSTQHTMMAACVDAEVVKYTLMCRQSQHGLVHNISEVCVVHIKDHNMLCIVCAQGCQPSPGV